MKQPHHSHSSSNERILGNVSNRLCMHWGKHNNSRDGIHSYNQKTYPDVF